MHQWNCSLSFSHALTHSLPNSCCCPWPWGGRGKRNETPKWTPKAAFGSILLEIVRDGLRTEWVQLQHRLDSGSSRSPERKKKKNKTKLPPKKEEKPCWSAITKLIGMAPSWDEARGCNMVTELLLPERCARGIETFLLWGSIQPLKPGIVLCIQPTHSEMFAPPCGASGTRWIPARNLLPSPEQSFSEANLCKTSKGAFYQKLFTFSISPQHLQETAGGRSTLNTVLKK